MLRLPLCCSILAGAVFVHAANEGLPASESLAGSAPLASFSAAGETSMQAAPGDLSRRAQTSAAPQSVTVNATGTMPLSLKRAVEIALTPEGNTRAALALETIAQANQRVREARAAFLPSIDGSVRDSRQVNNLQAFGFGFSFLVPGLSGFSIPTIVGPFTIFDTRGTIQQSALNFSDIRKYQASKVNAAAAAADNDATRNSVRDEVARAYLAALRADANRDTARANVELAQALRDLAVRQKEAGTGTGIEVTRAEVELANSRQQLVRAENDRVRTLLQLQKTMGLSMAVAIELTDRLSYRAVEIAGAETLLEQARKNRPELIAQRDRESAAQISYRAVKAERLPSIGASADYGTIGSSVVGSHPTYTMGASLRVPVFDGLRREARAQESFSQFRQEQIRLRDLDQQIELQVRTAIENLRSAAAEVEAARQGRALAEDELASARRRYEAGVVNSIEVTDAQTRLQRARDNEVLAVYDHNVAQLDLATATGTIAQYVDQQ